MFRKEIESGDYTIANPYADLGPIFAEGDSIDGGMKKYRPLKQLPKSAAKKAKSKRRMSKRSRKRNR